MAAVGDGGVTVTIGHFDLRIERSTRRPQFYSLRPSLCGQPAVDDEPRAGHEGGIVGGEKQRNGEAPVMVALAEGRRSAGESPLIPSWCDKLPSGK